MESLGTERLRIESVVEHFPSMCKALGQSPELQGKPKGCENSEKHENEYKTTVSPQLKDNYLTR